MKSDKLILIVAVYAAAWFIFARLPGDIVRSPIAGSDLSSYYTAGYLVRTGQGGHLYDVGQGDTILGDATSGPYRQAGDALGIARQHYYIYPPFFALAAAPLSFAPFSTARAAWLAMDLALLGLFLAIYRSWRRRDGNPAGLLELGLVAVTLGLEFLPLIWALAIGQTSLLLLALLAGALLLAKRGQDGAAGCLLGLATAIKLTPALAVIYFAVRGRGRLAAVAGGVFVGANLLAVAALGLQANTKFYLEIVPMMSRGTSYFLNQSLAGTFSRLVGGGSVRQVALETSSLVGALSTITGLALVAVTARVILRGRFTGRPPIKPAGLTLDLEYSAVLLLTLILSPISWSHHYILAVIPLYSIVAAAGRWELPARQRLALACVAGLAFLLIARKPHYELFETGVWRLALSAALLGALALWGSCLYLLAGAAPLRRAEKETLLAA